LVEIHLNKVTDDPKSVRRILRLIDTTPIPHNVFVEFREADEDDWIDDDDCSMRCDLLRELTDELNQAIHHSAAKAEKDRCCTELLIKHQHQRHRQTSHSLSSLLLSVVVVVILCGTLPVHEGQLAVHHVDDRPFLDGGLSAGSSVGSSAEGTGCSATNALSQTLALSSATASASSAESASETDRLLLVNSG